MCSLFYFIIIAKTYFQMQYWSLRKEIPNIVYVYVLSTYFCVPHRTFYISISLHIKFVIVEH